ncbi:PREDICTED: suppressor of SWI4 1 homolog isoform X2 [Pseudopodoces humilis]|uniref:suppressor of SWI4 1 homolog isoform X2 n=1 Tax=Pseudopodoces humilis TaxID=181119 RepID=UPI0006B87775|nr:PREDICTED: suppressor of SWI4 1 homolog isoform X2 [Pseudopodoces humilis]
MGRPGKSRCQRLQRSRARARSELEFQKVPHSFVFPRGRAGRSLRGLVRDLRKVLEPYTARRLQVRQSNSLRDLVAVAGPLGVTQFLALSKSQTGINLKLFRLPGGPTLTFKVLQYSLVRDVVSALRRHRMHEQQFLQPPLLVLGNFGIPGIQLRLMAGMFQGMFPALNVHRLNLNSVRRCLLISYDADSQLLEFRHYVQVVPVGLSRGIRKILQEKFPDLSRMDDVSELLTGSVPLSESEAEPDVAQTVPELPQSCAGRGNAVTRQSAIRLTEIGPRLTLQLLKVEEGLGQGNVLYHGLAPKGEAELGALRARREQRLQVRAERRRQQEQNLERKRQQRLRDRERSLAGMGRSSGDPRGGSGDPKGGPGDPRGGPGDLSGDSGAEDPGAPEPGEGEEPSDEDDAEYYRQELGEEPEPDLFPGRSKRKRSPSGAPQARKRRKRNQKSQPGTPKSRPGHPGIPKSQRRTPKFRPGSQKSQPGTPKSQPGTPKPRPGHPGIPTSQRRTPKFRPGSQKSQPGTPKSQPGTPKSHPRQPGIPKSQRGTPKSQRGTPKSHPGSPKSHPGSQKPRPGHPGIPKSQPREPGTPKSHPGHPKNPKSQRGKLLNPRKIPNFQRPRRARKGKN